MVVANLRAAQGSIRLDHRRSSEFAPPDNERVIQEASLFQIGQQGRGQLVGQRALRPHSPSDVAVVVPRFVKQRNKANSLRNKRRVRSAAASAAKLGAIKAGASLRPQGYGNLIPKNAVLLACEL